MKRNSLILASLALALPLLFLMDVQCGSRFIALSYFWQEGVEQRILYYIRLPKAITAILAGIALSVSGLQMQTLFRNPLAGPYILGVSSGATLGVAALVLCGVLGGFAATSSLTVLFAIAGATGILMLIMALSRRATSITTLLIVGMMVGSVAGALVNVMQHFANPDSLKLFITWTLGSLSSVSWSQLAWLSAIVGCGLALAYLSIRALNGLILGEDYARSLGINLSRTRLILIASTGLLAGGVTAFCGPIAFVGVAVPHLARTLLATSNHRLTMPATCLIGANMLLICDMLSSAFTYPLPISTISALFGAPIVVWILLDRTA